MVLERSNLDIEEEDRNPLPSFDEPWQSEAWQREVRKMPLFVTIATYREWFLHHHPKLTETRLEDMMEHWQEAHERELAFGAYVPDLRTDLVSPAPSNSPQSCLEVQVGRRDLTGAAAYPDEIRATWPALAQQQMVQESSSGTTSGASTVQLQRVAQVVDANKGKLWSVGEWQSNQCHRSAAMDKERLRLLQVVHLWES